MLEKERLIEVCVGNMSKKGLDSDLHKKRLMEEMTEVENQGEYDYYLDLHRRKVRFAYNESNLFIAYLLDLVGDFDLSELPKYVEGEYPDIDVDYLSPVRDYLKNEWVPKTFGEDNCCAISNYTTFGIKMSLIDMVRVHGKSREEILNLTTKLGLKDDEGKDLTWDKAMELYPELKKYCDENVDVATAAHKLLNRNRGMSTHAGGLIISRTRIDDLVPIVRGKDGVHASAFVEGLHGTDLGPLGLVKFDLLVIGDLMRIVQCCRLIKERHGIKSINALPDQSDWSDVSYLEDSQSLAMANQGFLKGIFQFDSKGIRQLSKEGGVDCFDDLVAYAALFRPGPLGSGMATTYVNRKKNLEEYEVHELMEPILGKTEGVMVFQEQVLRIFNVVGGISKTHCENVRSAISKKKEKIFMKYKDQFVKVGQKRLDWSEEDLEGFWDQIYTFAGYAFNKSHAVAYSYISSRLLWLKTHYPLEFFSATLASENIGEKIKEYKIEANRCEVVVNSIDINKSGWNFEIVEDEVYMGFSNVKGIGETVAQRIVEGQPYSSLDDFLNRFGVDAKVLKPLISLGIFDDDDRKTLYKFYEHFKDVIKKREARDIRNAMSREKIVDFTCELFNADNREEVQEFLDACLKMNLLTLFADFLADFNFKTTPDLDALWKLVKKYRSNVMKFEEKVAADKPILLENFDIVNPKILDEKLLLLLDEVLVMAETQFYGFPWIHFIEYSPDYEGGMTFQAFEEDEGLMTTCVECQICTIPQRKISKKENPYYKMDVEDSNGTQNSVIIWENDYERFQEEFDYWESDTRRGSLLKIRLERPNPPYTTFKFDSPPKVLRHKVITSEKKFDVRLKVMARPTFERKEDQIMDNLKNDDDLKANND